MKPFTIFKETVRFLLAVGCVVFVYFVYRSPAFGEGEQYTFYLGESSSAQAVTSRSPSAKLFLGGVKGESVTYSGDRYQEFCNKWRATLRFSEQAGGTTSYYLYSDRLGEGILLGGEEVNLQIAVDGEHTVVGTPLIFGGW